MILVTGASGKIGSEAVRLLTAKQLPTRALVRDPARAPQGGAEVAVGDFDLPETLDDALSGVTTLLLISPSVPSQEIAVIDSAVRHGVGHIVKVTNHKATADSPVPRRRDHARIEAHLRATGVAHTLLGPNLFMQNLFAIAPEVKQSHGFTMSTGDGRFGMVDARDVAATAAAIAASPSGHAGRSYLLTGPELITYTDVADALTAALGHKIDYHAISPGTHRKAMLEAGVPEPVATSNAHVFELIANGDAEWLSGDITTITGTQPRSLREFLDDHLAAFG
ncbi:SDR family oxidoreductase [Amycolatopsis ultiminotia]